MDETSVLHFHEGNLDKPMKRQDKWWCDSVHKAYNHVHTSEPHITSHTKSCNGIARLIWDWCIDHNIWLSTAHIPGKDNTLADKESRVTSRGSEWPLSEGTYNAAIAKIGVQPDIDLFTS